jgi:starch phosphorylase
MLVAGSDVWLNTPIKGQEACGTSGMKAAANGALQFAISDGWTDEVDLSRLGFSISPIDSASSFYNLLEESVAPLYYKKDADGVPQEWVSRMRETVLVAVQGFSSERMLREYLEKLYVPILD